MAENSGHIPRHKYSAEDIVTWRPPKYVISDGGTNLVNCISDSGIPRHRDVGHYFANCLKKVYGEDPDFKDLSERVGKTKHWSLDKDLAPLKARTRGLSSMTICPRGRGRSG